MSQRLVLSKCKKKTLSQIPSLFSGVSAAATSQRVNTNISGKVAERCPETRCLAERRAIPHSTKWYEIGIDRPLARFGFLPTFSPRGTSYHIHPRFEAKPRANRDLRKWFEVGLIRISSNS